MNDIVFIDLTYLKDNIRLILLKINEIREFASSDDYNSDDIINELYANSYLC